MKKFSNLPENELKNLLNYADIDINGDIDYV